MAVCLVLVLGVIAAAALYLRRTQSQAGADLRHSLTHRAGIAASMAGGGIHGSDQQNVTYAVQNLSGPAAQVPAQLDTVQRQAPQPINSVLDANGRLLAASPRSLLDRPAELATAAEVVEARTTGKVAVSNLLPAPDNSLFMLAVPYPTKYGTRVWESAVAVSVMTDYGRTLLNSAMGIPDGRAYILDGNLSVIAATGTEAAGSVLPDRALADALRRSGTGTFGGGTYYTSAKVPDTTWQVVFAVPNRTLLQPLHDTHRAAWLLFAAFVLAMLCLLALGGTTINQSARLAHERLHDALTGLPNRILFLEKARQALGRRRRGHVAALFIDLDGFKPVNDVYGHTAGDALLVAVAERLSTTARRGDPVSRFGGDEFLVLCRDLTGPDGAHHVAERIQRALAAPFPVDGHEIRIGSSIGIADCPQDVKTDAATLIHQADQAMYRAKHAGKGRIEVFSEALRPAPR